jgi:signal transduction histidine kinase
MQTFQIMLVPLLASLITLMVLRMTNDNIPPPPVEAQRFWPPLAPIVGIVVFASALILLIRLKRPTISALVLIGGWTFVTTFVWLRFGVTSYFPALLILPICAAGLLIDRVASTSLAMLAIALVGSAAVLEAQGMIPQESMPDNVERFFRANQYTSAVGFWVGLFAGVAALTSMLSSGLQNALKQTQTQAKELRELSDQLEARVAAQTTQILAQEREAATLEERARLAREIHDTIAQGLAGVAVQIGAAQRALAVAPNQANQHLDLAGQMTREALAEARRSVWNLRAAALERGDLSDALQSLAERHTRPELQVTFQQHGNPWPLNPPTEGALLRVAQEALSNVVKHAEATLVELHLNYAEAAVQLVVHDNGKGLQAPNVQQIGSFGLVGMRERLHALGGALEIQNNGGAIITARVPRQKEK